MSDHLAKWRAIWWHGSGPTLAQIMACCLTAPGHYLNQCWLIMHHQDLMSNFPYHSNMPAGTRRNDKRSLLRQNGAVTSFRCNNDVIIASCARWDTVITAYPGKGESLLETYAKCRVKTDAQLCCDYTVHVAVTWWADVVAMEMGKLVAYMGTVVKL